MLVKIFRCGVPPVSWAAFDQGQREWGGLAGVSGFVAQFGGRDRADPIQIVVVGLWRDHASYEHFMAHDHDRIFHITAQQDTYFDSTVTLAEVQHGMPASARYISEAVKPALYLRVADCRVRPARAAHFRDAQHELWPPDTPGFLGGLFTQDRIDPLRYLVLTLWTGEDEHDAYSRDRSRPMDDLDDLIGSEIRLTPGWTVIQV